MDLSLFQDFITITGNILTMSTAIGLMFGVIVQPRRENANWYFAVFLSMLAMWAYSSLALRFPALNPFLSRTQAFYFYLSGLGLTPIAYYLAIISFCNLRTRLYRILSAIAIIGIALIIVLIWAGVLVQFDSSELAANVRFNAILASFVILPPGYAALAFAAFFVVIAYVALRTTDTPRSRALQIPTLLLLAAYVGDFIEPLNRIPFDSSLITIAAVLIGYTIINQQVFNPLREMNEKLRIANQDLRRTVDALAAEKTRTEELNEELRTASQYKSEFLAKMSHELRTPLNSIVGYSELLLQGLYGSLNEKQADRLRKILRNGHNLLALINDILDLSKIEAGRLELTPEHVTFQSLLNEVLVSVEPQAQEKGLSLATEIAPDARPIFADPLRIRQVLTNLLSNAVKFTPEGTVALRIHNVDVMNGRSAQFDLPTQGWLSDGQWVLISVSDTGIGIAPEHHASIFDEFQQVDDTSTRQFSGTGLGLAITKRLVEMHGGHIWLQSDVGKGSTFFVALPASQTAAADAAGAAVPARPGKGAHILVIDDSQEAADILSTYLQEAGYRVSQASDGKTGLRLARELQPDVITTDILMPGMNGWEVIEHLREDPLTASTPIVIVSIIDQRPMSLASGLLAHISKPVRRDVLLNVIERIRQPKITHPILVVDDQPDDREIISTILLSAGLPVEVCDGGQQAVDWLKEHRASLVLLDLTMPQVNGFDVLNIIRETLGLHDLPVAILSAKELSPEEEAALSGHIAAIIKKQGLARSDLLNTIARVLH